MFWFLMPSNYQKLTALVLCQEGLKRVSFQEIMRATTKRGTVEMLACHVEMHYDVIHDCYLCLISLAL